MFWCPIILTALYASMIDILIFSKALQHFTVALKWLIVKNSIILWYYNGLRWILWLYSILFVCLCNQTLYCMVELEIVILIDHSNTVFLVKCLCYIFPQAFERAMSETLYTLEYARPLVSTWHCVWGDLQNQSHRRVA